MASTTDANDAIIDLITETAKTLSETKMSDTQARTEGIKNLAEAYAWMTSPNQPHG